MASDPIKHVFVLMLENRSFDQMLGCYDPDVDGVNPASPGVNRLEGGGEYRQRPIAESTFGFDPDHECESVLQQIADGNSGFIQNFHDTHDDADPARDYQPVMDYFARGQVAALHALADSFAVCDRWYSSLPGPTWPNRFFVHSGTSLGAVKMGPLHSLGYSQRTIYDEFDDHGITWAIYAGDLPQCLLLTRLRRSDRRGHFHMLDMLYSHCARQEQAIPNYVFIEPRYFLPHQNDDHPPHDVALAQELLASIYNAIRANIELWKSTLLVVLYDEHGGFYDHVTPPPAVPPDASTSTNPTFGFDQLGVRVPAVFVSPWIDHSFFGSRQGFVFDHTSLLKYVSDKWRLNYLNARVRQAQNFDFIVRSSGDPRLDDTPKFIAMPATPVSRVAGAPLAAAPVGAGSAKPKVAMPPLNENQRGLAAFFQIQPITDSELLHEAVAPQMAAAAATPSPQIAKAKFQEWIAGLDPAP
jgi:phospholipase C